MRHEDLHDGDAVALTATGSEVLHLVRSTEPRGYGRKGYAKLECGSVVHADHLAPAERFPRRRACQNCASVREARVARESFQMEGL